LGGARKEKKRMAVFSKEISEKLDRTTAPGKSILYSPMASGWFPMEYTSSQTLQ